MRKRLFLTFALLLVLPVAAWGVTIPLNTAFSNYDPGDPGYIDNYGEVTITDLNDIVQFDVSVNPSVAGADADLQWFYFNFTPDSLGPVSLLGSDIVGYNVDTTGTNSTHRPDGDGFFDVFVDFGDGTPRLRETSFTVSVASTDLSESNFLSQSVGGSKGAFTVAAHFQSTSTDPGSEFVGGNPAPVPEPATVLLLGSGLVGLAGFCRRKFKRS